MLIRTVLAVGGLFIATQGLTAQTINSTPLVQKPIEYQVIRTDNANFTTREGCLGLKFVSVYVIPTSGTKQKIESFAREIALTFPDEYDLVVEFTIDPYSTTEKSFTEEAIWLKNLRGFHFRNKEKNINKTLTFPSGTSKDELEKLFEIEEN